MIPSKSPYTFKPYNTTPSNHKTLNIIIAPRAIVQNFLLRDAGQKSTEKSTSPFPRLRQRKKKQKILDLTERETKVRRHST